LPASSDITRKAAFVFLSSSAGQTEETEDAVDLLPYLDGELSDDPHEYLYWRSGPTQAIRDERWKLIKYKRTDVTDLLEPPAAGWPTDAPLGLVTLLYDLQNDPGETTNVANRYPEIVEGLEAEFAEWNAQLPPPSEAILSAIRSAIIQVDGERVQLIY